METLSITSENPSAQAIAAHWPEYLMEAAELGAFLLSACLFTALFEFPSSPVHVAIADATLRRVLIGIAMAVTAISIFYSPWGKRSGAHLNPSVTLTFWMLGKVRGWDALFYVLAQFAGGIAGVALAAGLIGQPISHRAVNYAITVPGPRGTGVAFLAEFAISFLMMTTVLEVSNHRRASRFTPLFAATLVMIYISLEAPLSGMSMNPARTLSSALSAGVWTALWVYFTAPVVGMFLAARLYLLRRGAHRVFCAKLYHHNSQRCIFRCNYKGLS
jgi:aquaporin Z